MKKLNIFIVALIKLTVYVIALVGVIAFIGDSLLPSANSEFIIRISTFIGLAYLFSVYKAFRNTFTKEENSNTNNSTAESISRNEYPLKQSFQNTPQTNESSDFTQLSEIEKIERQYEKGIFTEQEKNDLINKILNEEETLFTNREIEKIKSNYKQILDPYRDKFLEIYAIEYVELEDLHNQGIIDEKMLISKLEILKINISKRIQKEIRFKSIKGFEVYQGLEVENGNAVGVIVEIINSKKIRAQLNSDNSLTQEWSIVDITPTGKVNSDIGDWELSINNFLLQDETAYNSFNELKIGDSYKEGEVFFVSNEEVKVFRILDKSISVKENRAFILCDFKTLQSYQDNYWEIPDVDTVIKFVHYFKITNSFLPITPKLIWSSGMEDPSSIKCINVDYGLKEGNHRVLISSKHKVHYGILVHTIKLKS